jgi:hypothetical protein
MLIQIQLSLLPWHTSEPKKLQETHEKQIKTCYWTIMTINHANQVCPRHQSHGLRSRIECWFRCSIHRCPDILVTRASREKPTKVPKQGTHDDYSSPPTHTKYVRAFLNAESESAFSSASKTVEIIVRTYLIWVGGDD